MPAQKRRHKGFTGFRFHFYGSFSNDIMAVRGLITKLFTVVCTLKNMHMCTHMSVLGAEVGKQFCCFCYLLLVFCFILLLKMLMLLLLLLYL